MEAPDTPLAAPRRLATPEREALLRGFAERERADRRWLLLEAAACLAGLAWWFQAGNAFPAWKSAALFAVGFLGLFDFLVGQLLASRKRLEDLRPDARFGVHTRDSLLAAVRRVCERLGLDPRGARVYLAREKEINAFALRLELLPGWNLFNGVQLNRAILHLLDEKELESVIGHELGHVYPYAPLASRCMLAHAVLSGTLSLLAAHLLRFHEVHLATPLLGIFLTRYWVFSSGLTRTRMVEFLCDDHGARAAGLEPAMTAEIKLALEQEARGHLLLRVLEAKLRHDRVPVADLLKVYEDALPFGGVDPGPAREQMEKGLRRRLEEEETNSAKGFFRFLFRSDDTDREALAASIARLRALGAVARVPVSLPEVLRQPHRLAECLGQIEAHPRAVLVRTEEEVDDRESTHPNVSRRLLYLWRNREAISRG